MKGSETLVRCLLEMGCDKIYGIIGTSILYFVDALYDVKDKIRYISCRHEQVAASMADAQGRLTQKPAVVLTHSGPGTLNSLISLANAYKDCSPVIAISGSVKRRLKGNDGMLEVDHLKIFSSICKGVYSIESTSQIPEIFSEAYKKSMSYAKGPVLIEVPEDVWLEEEDVDFSKLTFELETKQEISNEDINEVLELIKKSNKPLILAGGGVAYSNSSSLLKKVATILNIPVITTGNGRGTISELDPLCIGRVGFGGGNAVADSAFEKADLILAIGCSISDITTYEYSQTTSAEIVLINFDDRLESKGIYYSKHIYGDAKDFLEKLLTAISHVSGGDVTHLTLSNQSNLASASLLKQTWLNELEPIRNSWNQTLQNSLSSGKLTPAKVCVELSKLIPDDAIITVGAGTHLLYPMAFIPCKKPLTFLSAVNFGAMGFGFPAGLSAKLNFPDRVVISVLGDGDFMMTMQDIETAVREKIPLKVLIINDNAYRVLMLRQKLQLQGRVYGTSHSNPDFVKLAESFGAKGLKIEHQNEIESKLKEFLSSEVITILEVVTDQNDFPPTNIPAVLKMAQ